jgi:hypothetical protein
MPNTLVIIAACTAVLGLIVALWRVGSMAGALAGAAILSTALSAAYLASKPVAERPSLRTLTLLAGRAPLQAPRPTPVAPPTWADASRSLSVYGARHRDVHALLRAKAGDAGQAARTP